jgi:hypothetical protein
VQPDARGRELRADALDQRRAVPVVRVQEHQAYKDDKADPGAKLLSKPRQESKERGDKADPGAGRR